jgi:hypothetical protein
MAKAIQPMNLGYENLLYENLRPIKTDGLSGINLGKE